MAMGTRAERLMASGNRPITYLRLSVTDRCNLRCRYCMPAGGVPLLPPGELLSLEELIRVVRCLAQMGVTKVRVTGGEPLVRRGVVGLVRALAELPGIAEVVMTTNGLLLSRYASQLAAAGLKRLNLSLDTLVPERYRQITRGGSLPRFWEGVEAARAAGFEQLRFNCVVIRGFNDDELGRLAALTRDHPWQVRFIEYMPIGSAPGGPEWPAGYLPYSEIYETVLHQLARELALDLSELLERWEPVPTPPAATARVYRVRGFAGTIGFISPLGQHFCGGCNRLRLTADGRLHACLLAAGTVDLKPLLRQGTTDAQLRAALRQAARLKPAHHGLAPAAAVHTPKIMSRLGG